MLSCDALSLFGSSLSRTWDVNRRFAVFSSRGCSETVKTDSPPCWPRVCDTYALVQAVMIDNFMGFFKIMFEILLRSTATAMKESLLC
jgi:hypothetical protein